MYSIKLYFLSALFLSLSLISCDESSDKVTTVSEPKEDVWVLNEAKSDEFDDWNSNKWGTTLWYTTTTDFAFNPDNVTVGDGYLRLAAKMEDYEDKNYTCGSVISKFLIGDSSRVEIRAKTIDYQAHVTTALWMADKPIAATNPNVEIDIMETFLWGDLAWPSTKFSSTAHYWWIGNIPDWALNTLSTGDQNLGYIDYNSSKPLSNDFHVWMVERYKEKLRFYFDGKLYWTLNPKSTLQVYEPVVKQERYVIFSIEGHGGTPIKAYLPGEFLIDYVRTYDLKK